MNTSMVRVLLVFMAGALSHSLTGQTFVGTEDFSGDASKWYPPFQLTANPGGGAFTFGATVTGASASPVLQFTKSGGGQGDQMLVWNTSGVGNASFTTSWVMQAEATNLATAGLNKFAAIGIEVSTGAGSYTGIMLESFGGIGTTVLLETNDFEDQIYDTVALNTGVILQLAWDASAQLLTGSYSLNSGVSFATLGVVDIMSGPDQWQVPPTGGFSFEVFGYSNLDEAIPAETMYLDNFSITAVPEPSTYAAMAGALMLGFSVWKRRAKQA